MKAVIKKAVTKAAFKRIILALSCTSLGIMLVGVACSSTATKVTDPFSDSNVRSQSPTTDPATSNSPGISNRPDRGGSLDKNLGASNDSPSSGQAKNGIPAFLDPPIEQLPAPKAISQLHTDGFMGKELCKDRHRLETGVIPDFGERELGSPVPLVNSNFANIYAVGAAGVVYKSYEALEKAWADPTASQLLCIARLIAQPRLEVEWGYLGYLLEKDKYIKGLKFPTHIATVAIRSGEAIVMGCLEAEPYGDIYTAADLPEGRKTLQPQQDFVFETTLAWIGGRWRIQALKDFPTIRCEALQKQITKKHLALETDIKAGFDDWILGDESWIWTKKEIQKWLHS